MGTARGEVAKQSRHPGSDEMWLLGMIVMLNPYIIVYEAPLEGRGMTTKAKAGSTYGQGPAAVRAIENQILPAIERMNADGCQCTSKTLAMELGISNEGGQPALAEHLCKLRNGGALRKEGASTTTNWIVADPDKQPKQRPVRRTLNAPNRTKINVGTAIAAPMYRAPSGMPEHQIAALMRDRRFEDDPRPVGDVRL